MLKKQDSNNKYLWVRSLIGAMLIIVALIGFKLTPIATWIKPENIRLLQKQAGIAPIGFILIYAIATILAFPASILTLWAGANIWHCVRNFMDGGGRYIGGDWCIFNCSFYGWELGETAI